MLLLAPGELTRPTPTADLKGGRPSRRGRSQESSVNRDWSANPHPWTGALRSGTSPSGDGLTCALVDKDKSAPSAAAARGLHKGRHWLTMTAESRLPSTL